MEDTLIWKSKLTSISTTHYEMKDSINDVMHKDPEAKKLMDLDAQEKTRLIWIEHCLLLTTGRIICPPKFISIRRRINKEIQDKPGAGNLGK